MLIQFINLCIIYKKVGSNYLHQHQIKKHRHCEERASRVRNGQGEEPCRAGTFIASEVNLARGNPRNCGLLSGLLRRCTPRKDEILVCSIHFNTQTN